MLICYFYKKKTLLFGFNAKFKKTSGRTKYKMNIIFQNNRNKFLCGYFETFQNRRLPDDLTTQTQAQVAICVMNFK